jgi:hypothetical protein
MWLPTDGGDRARYKLLDALLVLGTQAASGAGSWTINPQRVIRPAALVVAFTPLWDTRIVYVLHQLKRAGRKVVAVVIDVSDLLPATDLHPHLAARRLWQLSLDDRRSQLAASGVPTVFWPSQTDIGPVIARAARVERKVMR